MSIKERVRLLQSEEKNKSIFAKKIGMHPATVASMFKNMDGSINHDTALKILQAYPKVNPLWFFLGEGDIYLSDEESKELHEDASDIEDLMTNISIMFSEFTSKQIDLKDEMLDMQKQRIKTLEQLLKQHAPEVAKDFGIK